MMHRSIVLYHIFIIIIIILPQECCIAWFAGFHAGPDLSIHKRERKMQKHRWIWGTSSGQNTVYTQIMVNSKSKSKDYKNYKVSIYTKTLKQMEIRTVC